jgi:quercetin dioxygenase-like cupin family protein
MRFAMPGRRAALIILAVLLAAAASVAVLFSSIGGTANAAAATPTSATTAPPPGPVVTPVADALVPGPIKIARKATSDVLTARIDFRPGDSTGWHFHPGPVLVQVAAGQITLSHAEHGRCVSQVVTAGNGFFERPGAIHVADNRGRDAAVVFATFVLPEGAPPSVATPTPKPCR